MSKKIRSLVSLVLVAVVFFAGGIYAKSVTEKIEVKFDNITVYKDNILQDLKDAQGKTVEPFIYNGTTYVPVRAAAELAGLKVEWDGAKKAIHLWDKIEKNTVYLVDVRPPHAGKEYKTYAKDRESFSMGSMEFKKGVTIGEGYFATKDTCSAFFNLNDEYTELEMSVGCSYAADVKYISKLQFVLDDKIVKEVEIKASDIPTKITVPVKGGLNLEMRVDPQYKDTYDYRGVQVGIGEIIAR